MASETKAATDERDDPIEATIRILNEPGDYVHKQFVWPLITRIEKEQERVQEAWSRCTEVAEKNAAEALRELPEVTQAFEDVQRLRAERDALRLLVGRAVPWVRGFIERVGAMSGHPAVVWLAQVNESFRKGSATIQCSQAVREPDNGQN